jgi:anti-sigma B factor antagonist
MNSLIHQRFPSPGEPERPRRGTVPRRQVTAAGSVLAAVPRYQAHDVASRPPLSVQVRDDVAVVSLRGELDSSGVSALQAHLSQTRWQGWTRCVADLAKLVSVNRLCLGVLVRHNREIQRQDGTFALAGPQAAVLRVLSVTGLLTWFEVHDTVDQAVASPGGSSAGPALFRKC